MPTHTSLLQTASSSDAKTATVRSQLDTFVGCLVAAEDAFPFCPTQTRMDDFVAAVTVSDGYLTPSLRSGARAALSRAGDGVTSQGLAVFDKMVAGAGRLSMLVKEVEHAMETCGVVLARLQRIRTVRADLVAAFVAAFRLILLCLRRVGLACHWSCFLYRQ